jgi:hypothetical protein
LPLGGISWGGTGLVEVIALEDAKAEFILAGSKSVSKKSENKMLDICSGMRYEKEWKSDLRIPLM